jgi:chitodextrinase
MTRALPFLSHAVRILLLTVLFGTPVLSAQSRDRTPPTALTNLRVTAMTEHSVTLAWGPSTDNSGRFEYHICCVSGLNVVVSQSVTTHTLQGLQSGRTYIFRAYARDAAGNLSKSSNAVTVTLTGVIAAPTKPVVTVQDVGPTHVSLSWSSTDDGPIIWYTIYVDGEVVSALSSGSGTFTCSAVLVPTYCVPIDQETTYTFTVRARDADGNLSPFSDPVVVTTDPADPNDRTPPTQPSNVTAQTNGGFIEVSWGASTDTVAPQQFIRYDVYVNGELRQVVVGGTFAEVDFYFGETNVIEVIAVDTADNESVPGTIIVIT